MKMKLLAAAVLATGFAGAASAGNIYLTGHDVLLHSGQNGYDNVILNYLLDGSEAAANYNLLLLRGFSGSVGTLGVNTLEGFGTITTVDIATFAGNAAGFVAALGGIDAIVIPSHTSCGGCDLSTADADILESLQAEITSFFNAGGDIYANSGATDTTFYNFLPPGVASSGAPIGASSGFTATAAGLAIGILPNMINGFPTHNRFSSFAPAFTVFETRAITGAAPEVISIGLRGGRIVADGITTDGTTVPEPGTLALLGVAALGFALQRKRS